MLLTPTEMERLTIYVAAELARKRRKKGLKLNHPESVALISDELLRHRDFLSQEDLYDGDIVDEMLNAWEQELQENDPSDSPEMQFVRGYCMALNRVGGVTGGSPDTP